MDLQTTKIGKERLNNSATKVVDIVHISDVPGGPNCILGRASAFPTQPSNSPYGGLGVY